MILGPAIPSWTERNDAVRGCRFRRLARRQPAVELAPRNRLAADLPASESRQGVLIPSLTRLDHLADLSRVTVALVP
jgi:hypothetical protein